MMFAGNAGAASPSSSLFSKPRGLTKSNTMAAAANRSIGPGTSVGRRSTIGYESKSSSNEKTNAIGGDGISAWVKTPNQLFFFLREFILV